MSELVKQETEVPVATLERTRDNPTFTPRFDIFENEDELVLSGDLPGVSPDDLDIRFENGQLTILGKVAPRLGESNLVFSEYGVGDFERSFAIGEAIDTEKISADLKHGVLTLHLPKTEAVKPRRIQVTAG